MVVLMTSTGVRATARLGEVVAQGRKPRWLASQIGVSESHLSRVVSGERRLQLTKAEALADLLRVDLADVFDLSALSIGRTEVTDE
jgi:plasmid maintenance system antidote protein VapI